MRNPRWGVRWTVTLASILSLVSCGSPSGPDGDDGPPDPDAELGREVDPGPGPHFSVVPVELEKLARVTPVGTNGKILPIAHTYWYTCDTEYLLPIDRPCVRERLPVRAPRDGIVFLVEEKLDGNISFEGPPGLLWGFAHVTPAPGLERGDSVFAGDTIATMFTDFAFDFGVTNYGLEDHPFVNAERYESNRAFLHAQSPIEQYPEPLRSELIARVSTESDPFGRVSFDVAGTAAGGWFLTGTPYDESLTAAYETAGMFLGPLQERSDVRIISTLVGVKFFHGVLRHKKLMRSIPLR